MQDAVLPLPFASTIRRLGSPTGAKAAARNLTLLSFACMASYLPATAQSGGAYKVTNIVSDGSVAAITTDASFINPWAVSSSPTWWISAQGTGFNYVTQVAGTIPFKVIVPAASGLATATGLPAGSVTTAGATGVILPNGTKASFLFSTLDGTISGWNSKLGTANAIAQIAVNNSAAGASYPGLAIINTATASYILAPNFGTGNAIEVYDGTFKPTKLAGTFTDPNLPANYAPFSVHVLGSQVFVAYALRTTATPYRPVNGAGNGVVSVFDFSGNFVARVVTGGNLDAPWGVAFAPASFGIFSKDLLIGNFGNGIINVYDPKTYAFLGQLIDGTGTPLAYASLWELLPGGTAVGNTTSVSGGDPGTVYFTAGLTNEAHGLFAGISNDSTSSGTPAFGVSASTSAATVTAGSSVQATISVAPTYNFSGTVTLACANLPAGASCTFAPAQLTVSPTASSTGTVTIQTSKTSANLAPRHPRTPPAAGIASALLLPFASILVLLRRRSSRPATHLIRLTGAMLVLIASTTLMVGCASSSSSMPGTPTGQSNVVITASGGTLTHQTTIALMVQ
jgi:uncharacterized protein (TIGR03118 family)